MTRSTDTHTRLADAARCRALAPESADAKLARRFAAIQAKATANARDMHQLTGRLAAW
jgi:hypothetical protein